MTFSGSLWFASTVAWMFAATFGTHYPKVIYLSNYCGGTFYVDSDVRIKLSTSIYLPYGDNCILTLKPSVGTEILARFISYKINSGYVSEQGNCKIESIQLYDDNRMPVLGPYDQYCSAWKPNGQFYLGSSGQFCYKTGLFSYIVPADVDMLVTVVTRSGSYGNSTCPQGFFDCSNSYCVTKSVTCNGYDDCSNNRDEIEGCGLSTLVVGGIIAGCIIFVVFVIVLSLLFRRYRRRAAYVRHY